MRTVDFKMKIFLILFGVLLFDKANGEFTCNDFHFGYCDITLGGVIDSFELTPSDSAISLCQKACQVGLLQNYIFTHDRRQISVPQLFSDDRISDGYISDDHISDDHISDGHISDNRIKSTFFPKPIKYTLFSDIHIARV